MAMGFFVGAHRELGDMSAHRVFREVELHVGTALAALAVIGELERMRIRHKVRSQEEPALQLSLSAEISLGAWIETVEEGVIAVKNVIGIMKQVHHEAAVRDREVARGFAAARVEKLMIGV